MRSILLPVWLVSFSDRFGLYGRSQMRTLNLMEEDPVEAFRDRAVRLLKDLAEAERLAHRGKFDHDSHQRADTFDRAAQMVEAMARVKCGEQ